MRHVQRIPRPLRRMVAAIASDAFRAWLRACDYQVGQMVATYQHHLALAPPGWQARLDAIRNTTNLLRHRKRILFYPSLPGPGFIPYKLCLHLGYAITNDPTAAHHASIKWKNATYAPNDEVITAHVAEGTMLNATLTDISKRHVMDAFERTFGYALRVNPHTFTGQIVRKSDLNATHDGVILQGPLPITATQGEDSYVYQRLVNNVEKGRAQDLRVPIMGDRIPFVRIKYRPVEKRFDYAGQSQIGDEIRSTKEVFSSDERNRILDLCRAMGLDYGELDVLRDNGDRRIYVVDVNNTPTGPTFVSANTDTQRAWFDTMAETFRTLLFTSSDRTVRRLQTATTVHEEPV